MDRLLSLNKAVNPKLETTEFRNPMAESTRVELARKQIEFARQYTFTLIDDLDDSLWFTIPDGCVTSSAAGRCESAARHLPLP